MSLVPVPRYDDYHVVVLHCGHIMWPPPYDNPSLRELLKPLYFYCPECDCGKVAIEMLVRAP